MEGSKVKPENQGKKRKLITEKKEIKQREEQ